MLRETGPALALAALIGIAGFGLSKEVSQNDQPQQPPREQRSSSSDQQQKETNLPPSVHIKCDPNCSNDDTEEHRNETRFTRFINKTVDDPVALATFTLGTITLLLVGVVTYQVRDARVSADRQACLTREAIKLGNREFAATHRPRIRVAYIRPNPLQPGQQATAQIWAINVGDGDAEITELSADIFVRRIDTAGTGTIVAPIVPYPGLPPISPGQQANIDIRGRAALMQQEINGINGSPNAGEDPWLHLCAVGTIHYLDANRTHRLTSFFRIYNPNRLRFMRAPDDDQYAEWDYEA
jgi:hypothetical protein